MKNKIVIVGCGNVGMSYAYALLNQRTLVTDIILIDINEEKAKGEAMDLNHCLSFSPSKIKIKAGNYSDCSDARIVCLAAGANQTEGETRIDLVYKNHEIFKSIVPSVMKSGFNGIFLVATNPLDIMTYITYKYSSLDPSQIIGSGTSLDTARLMFMVGEKLGYSPKSVGAYVIGEHGDSEFVPWSIATIGQESINKFLNEEDLIKIEDEVRNAAYEIIKRKNATYYGIGTCLVRITNAILEDENSIITVSTYDSINDVFIGLPAIINKNGIKRRVFINLTDNETLKLKRSIDIIKEVIDKINE